MNGEPSNAAAVPDKDAWTRFWANLCGGLLVGGFLWPLVVSAWEETQVIWFWDMMKGSDGGAIFGMLLPLFLGIAAFVIGNVMSGTPRAIALFAAASGVLLLSNVLTGGASSTASVSPVGASGGAAGFVMVLMLLSSAAIAVGNRLRKGHPRSQLPRLMAGIGGCVLLVSFVIPAVGGKPVLACFFEGMIWKAAWPMLLLVLAVLGYGVLGTICFRQPDDVQPFCRVLSLVARGIIVAFPVSILATGMFATSGSGFVTAVMGLIKVCGQLYGQLFLVAVGLAAWLEEALAGASGGAAPAGVSPTPNS